MKYQYDYQYDINIFITLNRKVRNMTNQFPSSLLSNEKIALSSRNRRIK